MIRVLTPLEIDLLGKRQFASDVRVEIKDGDGTFQKLEDFFGKNWILGINITNSVEDQVNGAVVTLRRDAGGEGTRDVEDVEIDSLAPLIQNTRLNLKADDSFDEVIGLNREIKISARIRASDPHGLAGVETPVYDLIFHGFTDKVSWAGDALTIDCRDLGKKLQNDIVPQPGLSVIDGVLQEVFVGIHMPASNAPTQNIEDVIQQILDDLATATVPTLFFPSGTVITPRPGGESPGFIVDKSWTLKPASSILSEINRLIDDIGFVVRYRWHANTSKFQLVMYDPADPSETIQRSFNPQEIISVDEMSVSDQDIFNNIQVIFTNTAGELQGAKGLAIDATSIADFGTRRLQLGGSSTAAIKTITDANDLADLVLAQLKDPKHVLSITVPFFHLVEIHDFLRLFKNRVHFDTDLVAKVQSFEHIVGTNDSVTRIFLVDGSDFFSFVRLIQINNQARGRDAFTFSNVLYVQSASAQSIADDADEVVVLGDEVLDALAMFGDNVLDVPDGRTYRISAQVTVKYIDDTSVTDPNVELGLVEGLSLGGPFANNGTAFVLDTTAPVVSGSDSIKTVTLDLDFFRSEGVASTPQEMFLQVHANADPGKSLELTTSVLIVGVYTGI